MATGDPYASPAELAEYLRMDLTAEDEGVSNLTLALAAATLSINTYTGRDFNLATTATARYFDSKTGILQVDDIGHATISVAADTTQDGTYSTAWTTSDFQVNPLGALAKGEPITSLIAVGSYAFPSVVRREGLVRVTARWGWPEVPADIKVACLILAAKLYKRRDSAEGVLGASDFGIVRVGSRLDPDVKHLIDPHRYLSV